MKPIKLLALIFLMISCEDDSDIKFSGITETNESGDIVGTIDQTDWTLDDVWTEAEEKIFESTEYSAVASSNFHLDFKSADGVGPAYPNPCLDKVYLPIHTTADSIQIAIVNEQFDIKVSFAQTTDSFYSLLFNVSDLTQNKIYRVYYKLFYTDGMIEKGHGDIKVN